MQLPGQVTGREHSLVLHELCREGRKELGFLILRDIALINKEEQI